MGTAAVTALLVPLREQINSTTTALAVGQLSAREKRRAEEAKHGEREIERLYKELQAAFERASEAAALKQSERLKSALLDAVTHDLRTPLTSIKASITTLIDEARAREFALDQESRAEMLQVIDEESDRLSRFIDGLIDLARIDAGELQPRRQWGAIEEIVSTALARARPLTQEHELEVKIEDESPPVRMGLAIAKGIVEAHGGKIWIETATDGHGTRVVFVLPVGDVEKTAA